jgi:hypothetical protein
MKRRLRKWVKVTLSITLALLMVLGLTVSNAPGSLFTLRAQAVEMSDEEKAALIEALSPLVANLTDATFSQSYYEENDPEKVNHFEEWGGSNVNLSDFAEGKAYPVDFENIPDASAVAGYQLLQLGSGEDSIYIAKTLNVVDGSLNLDATLVVFNSLVVDDWLEGDQGASLIVFPMSLPEGKFYTREHYDNPGEGEEIWGDWTPVTAVSENDGMMEFEFGSFPNPDGDGDTWAWLDTAVPWDGGGDDGPTFDVSVCISNETEDLGGSVEVYAGDWDKVVFEGMEDPLQVPCNFMDEEGGLSITITAKEGFLIKRVEWFTEWDNPEFDPGNDPEESRMIKSNVTTVVDPQGDSTDSCNLSLTQNDIPPHVNVFTIEVDFAPEEEEPEEEYYTIIINDYDDAMGKVQVYAGQTVVADGKGTFEISKSAIDEVLEQGELLVGANANEGYYITEFYIGDSNLLKENEKPSMIGAQLDSGDFVDDTLTITPVLAEDESTFFIILKATGAGRTEYSREPVKSSTALEDGSTRYEFKVNDWKNVYVEATPFFEEKNVILSNSWEGTKATDESTHTTKMTLSARPEANAEYGCYIVYGKSDEDKLADIAEKGYAYYAEGTGDAAVNQLKLYLAEEIFTYYFKAKPDGEAGQYDDFKSEAEVAAALNATTGVVTSPLDEVGLPYVDFTLSINGKTTTIRVYKFEHSGDFIVQTIDKGSDPENPSYSYTVATGPQNEHNEDTSVQVPDFEGLPWVYGNGVQIVGVVDTDDQNICTGHVTQERSGLEDDNVIGKLNFRVIIVPVSAFAIKITGDKICDGWDFLNIDTFTTSDLQSDAVEALIFIESSKVTVSGVNYVNTEEVLKVKAIGLAAEDLDPGVITVTKEDNGDFTVSFNSAYDLIPLKITFTDDSVKYITLHRVALRLNSKAETGIYATYYYPTGKTAPGAGDKPTFFATIKTKSGKTVTKVITEPMGELKITEDESLRNQENFSIYSQDFLIWANTEEEAVSIEVIAYKAGNATKFDGVLAGSGKGVSWKQPEKQ